MLKVQVAQQENNTAHVPVNLEIGTQLILLKKNATLQLAKPPWIKTMLPYIYSFLSAFLSFIRFDPAGN